MVLFFDLDGPILDVSKKYFTVYSQLVTELGGSPLESEEYWVRKQNRVTERRTLGDSHLKEEDFEAFRVRRKDLIETPAFWRHDIVWSEIFDAMKVSPWKGQLILVTLRNDREALLEELHHLGIADWFETILSTGGDAAGPDRHEAKVQLIKDHFPGQIPSGWFVGDTETDLRAGKALHLQTVAVTFGIRSEPLLRAEKPDHIVRTPGELAAWVNSFPAPAAK